jgi:arsenate reductase
MAEGYANALYGDRLQAYSSGVRAQTQIDPRAVQVMAEDGVDISHQYPKTLASLEGQSFDWVITVCDHAHETCPLFATTTQTLHQSFDDPPKRVQGLSPDEALDVYRRVRDEIKQFLRTFTHDHVSPQPSLKGDASHE